MQCTECGGPMTEGALVDFRRDRAAASEWVPGRVESSVWTGSLRNTTRFKVTAFRCDDCGYLKMFARDPTMGSPSGS
jgi:hypothetical protein